MVISKLNYIIKKVQNIRNIKILELGVASGQSTKLFLKLCKKNKGKLVSVDILDCSSISNDKRWTFIKSSDDNFYLINKYIKKLDLIFIDSLHEPNHVKKIFYNYYKKLKINGICIIDDISWLPYTKNSFRDNSFTERINRLTFQKILEIYNSNKENFSLEFLFEGSGLALITKKSVKKLNIDKKIYNRTYSIKNILKKIYSPNPIN
jgi:predicted O-methyltransferase YrrM